MEIKQNERGFSYSEFTDQYGEKCSIQKSSAAMFDAIWFGIDNPTITVFDKDNAGKYIKTDLPSNFMISSQMHLTQEMVRNLLPTLIRFAETGELEP